MNKLLLIVLFFVISLATAGVVSAQTETNCTPIYGGGTSCVSTGLVIDKKVKHPQVNTFVDNLTVNDPKYAPDQSIAFRINVTNTGTTDFAPVTITDTLPLYLTGVTGSGSFNVSNNTVTFTLDSLKAGETKSVEFQATTASESALPTNQGITCVTNKAQAQAANLASEDIASYCIQKQVLADIPTTKGGLPVYPEPTITETPKTGPEALAFAALVPGSALGYFLRKKAK